MGMYQCQKCGQSFENKTKRKYCSKECRTAARAHYYLTLDLGYGEQIVSLPPPKGGWVAGEMVTYPMPEIGKIVMIKVDQRGNVSHQLQSASGWRIVDS